MTTIRNTPLACAFCGCPVVQAFDDASGRTERIHLSRSGVTVVAGSVEDDVEDVEDFTSAAHLFACAHPRCSWSYGHSRREPVLPVSRLIAAFGSEAERLRGQWDSELFWERSLASWRLWVADSAP